MIEGVRRALTNHRAATSPDAPDPALRGRSYTIPHDRVWSAAIAMVDGGLKGWTVTSADPTEGVIRAESRAVLRRVVDDIEIRIRLDRDGWTRVDLVSESRVARGDLGANRRRIRRFLAELDRRLGARNAHRAPAQRTRAAG